MIQESHWNIAFIIALLLSSAVYSAKKTDFGTLTACVNENRSLEIQCFYPFCDNTQTFNCDIYDVDGNRKTLIGSSNRAMVNSSVSFLNASSKCQLSIKGHAMIYNNQTKYYTCNLSRKKSKEQKNITVKHFEQPKVCLSGGLFPHGVSGLLWSITILFFQETHL